MLYLMNNCVIFSQESGIVQTITGLHLLKPLERFGQTIILTVNTGNACSSYQLLKNLILVHVESHTCMDGMLELANCQYHSAATAHL